MSLTSSTTEMGIAVINDPTLVRERLNQIRDAYVEVALTDLVDDDGPAVEKERRRSIRTALQIPVTLMPADWSCEDDHMVVICGPEQVGVTRDISPTGLGVTHDHLLGSETAVIVFDLPGEGPVSLLLDLRWSVCQSHFCFMSGGCIIGLVRPGGK